MTTNHDEIQEQIPAYLLSRLGAEERAMIESHLRECGECSEMLRSFEAIRDAAPALAHGAGEHPVPSALMALARGEKGVDGEALRAHLDKCVTCDLELAAWKNFVKAGFSGAALEARPPGGLRLRVYGGLLAAALGGVIVGGAWISEWGSPEGTRGSAPAQNLRQVASPPVNSSISALRSDGSKAVGGAAALIGPLRNLRGGDETPTFAIAADHFAAILLVTPDLPASGASNSKFRFQILGADGRTLWSAERTGASIVADLEAADVVSFAVPASVLPDGRYRVNVFFPDEETIGTSFEFAISRQPSP